MKPTGSRRPSIPVAELRRRLEEAEQALEAIRTGQVESVVVEGPGGLRIFSLEGAGHAYRVLVEAMSEGAATLGPDGTILYCNARLARMLGAPLERVLGSPLGGWMSAASRGALEGLLHEAGGSEGRQELTLVAQGGEEIPVLLSLSGIEDEGRSILCAVATDLREQQRQERIIASETFARSILEQAGDAIVVCDAEGRIVRASRAAERLCGRSPLRLPLQEAFPVRLGAHGGAMLAEVVTGGVTVTGAPASMPLPGGGRAELLVSSSPLEGQGGWLGFVLSLVDITAQREDEARLAEALRRAEEGEAEKAEALQALREADRNKTQFLAMLSHELRNPLEPIRNCVYILENAPPGGEQALRAREVIQRQTEHMARLIDDLLDITRISRGKIQLAVRPLDLREVVLRTVEDHRPAFEAGEVGLEVGVPAEELVVDGDRTRLAQILGNLLQNVTKFTPRGGHAWVSLAADAAGEGAILRVSDDGPGIPPAMRSRLFEPFWQADETLDRSRGGLGLGLSLVRALVELHGGRVEAEAAGPHGGAAFTVWLPRSATPLEARPDRAPTAGRGRRVLIIEDSADSAETLQVMLRMAGHAVEVAATGPEGLDQARRLAPEVVICDIGLPGLDGYGVARAMRLDPRLREAYLVALSGYATPGDVAQARAAGFDRHLAKPVDAAVLLGLVAAGRPGGGAEVASPAHV